MGVEFAAAWEQEWEVGFEQVGAGVGAEFVAGFASRVQGWELNLQLGGR